VADCGAWHRRRKSDAQLLVEERTGRELEELLRELYVDRGHSQDAIAAALEHEDAARP
jgi:hypothetical protein